MTTERSGSVAAAPDSLDQALARLPREIEPGRDLWPAIEARLDARPGRRAGRWAWAVAAGAVLVVASSLVTVSLVRREAPVVAQQAPSSGDARVTAVAFGPGQSLGPAYDAARRDLARTLSARIDRLPPDARQKLERNLAEMRRASAEINAALELSPGDPLLEELLLNAYQDELAVLASVTQLTGGNGAGTTTDASRMQL
jgi:hypothetical protein